MQFQIVHHYKDIKMDYYYCEKCNGTGVIEGDYFSEKIILATIYYCCYCKGTGKVDWITNITKNYGPLKLKGKYMGISEYNKKIERGRKCGMII